MRFILMIIVSSFVGGLTNFWPFNIITAIFAGIGVATLFEIFWPDK